MSKAKRKKKRKRLNTTSNSQAPTSKKQKMSTANNKTTNNTHQNVTGNNDLILNELLYQRSQIKHLHYTDRILLLGEGDFSFAASLSHLGFCNIVATSYNHYNSVIQKYPNSKHNIALVKRMKNICLHNIDINTISEHKYFKSLTKQSQFDKIIFNFPHSGVPNYEYKKSIPSNQTLIRAIFRQSSNLLKNSGELHIALKSEPIYNSWDVQTQCREVKNGLALKQRIVFKPELYFGYSHTTTNTANNTKVLSNKSFVWIFGMCGHGIELDSGVKFSVGMYKCKACHVVFNSEKRFEMHMNSKKHNQMKSIANKSHKKRKKKKSKMTVGGKRRF